MMAPFSIEGASSIPGAVQSSIVTIDLSDAIAEIAKQLMTTMTGTQLVTMILGAGLIAGGTLVTRAYIKQRAETVRHANDLNHALAMSAEETRKLEVVAGAKRDQPRLAEVDEHFNEVRDEVLRAGSTAEVLDFEGARLTGAQARSIARKPRTQSTEEQLNGVYTIGAVTWPSDDQADIELRSVERTEEFTATLATQSLTAQDKRLLATAEWNREPVYFSINARRLRGRITSAVIVGLDWEKLRRYMSAQQPGRSASSQT